MFYLTFSAMEWSILYFKLSAKIFQKTYLIAQNLLKQQTFPLHTAHKLYNLQAYFTHGTYCVLYVPLWIDTDKVYYVFFHSSWQHFQKNYMVKQRCLPNTSTCSEWAMKFNLFIKTRQSWEIRFVQVKPELFSRYNKFFTVRAWI